MLQSKATKMMMRILFKKNAQKTAENVFPF